MQIHKYAKKDKTDGRKGGEAGGEAGGEVTELLLRRAALPLLLILAGDKEHRRSHQELHSGVQSADG